MCIRDRRSFANSGPTWGSSAKRITVVRHTGFWGIGFAKVSDLTLQDVAVCRTGDVYKRQVWICASFATKAARWALSPHSMVTGAGKPLPPSSGGRLASLEKARAWKLDVYKRQV